MVARVAAPDVVARPRSEFQHARCAASGRYRAPLRPHVRCSDPDLQRFQDAEQRVPDPPSLHQAEIDEAMSRTTPNRPFSTGRGSFAALAAIILFSLAPLAAARAAAAQVAEAWVHATPIEALGIWQSARLTAMGGLTVSSEDRFSRLNAYEYGMNPAGLLGLRDTSWAEQGSEYQSFDDGYYGESHSAVSRKSGVRGAVQQPRWAIGMDFIYASVNASRHDLI